MEAIEFMDDFFLRSGSKYPTLMELPFAKHQIQWGRSRGEKKYVHGKLNGAQELSLEIDLWELELPLEGKPKFLVHQVTGSWLKLHRPRDFYLETMKVVLVAAYFLIFAKQNPNSSQGAVWRYVRKECRDFKSKPNEKDLIKAILLVQSIVRTDPILQASPIIPQFFPNLSKNMRQQVVQGSDHSRKLLPVKQEILPVAKARTPEGPSSAKKADTPGIGVIPPAVDKSKGISSLQSTPRIPSLPEFATATEGDIPLLPVAEALTPEGPSSAKKADTPGVEVTPPAGDKSKGIPSLQSTPRIPSIPEFATATEGDIPLFVDEQSSKKRKAGRAAGSIPRRKGKKIDQGSEIDWVDWVDEPDVCAFCDDGVDVGDILLCCDGPCMRSFHPTEESGKQNKCITLGLSKKALREVKNWTCPNCAAEQHQCFACGKLGSSATSSAYQEVFLCGARTCKRFYHPDCVAELLVPVTARKSVASNSQPKLVAFVCPLHKCAGCQLVEDKTDRDLCLIKCRRCPTAWHEKCLPLEFRNQLWLLESGKHVMYCGRHIIVPELETPTRDHIIFPGPQKAVKGRGRQLDVRLVENRKSSSVSPGSRYHEFSAHQK